MSLQGALLIGGTVKHFFLQTFHQWPRMSARLNAITICVRESCICKTSCCPLRPYYLPHGSCGIIGSVEYRSLLLPLEHYSESSSHYNVHNLSISPITILPTRALAQPSSPLPHIPTTQRHVLWTPYGLAC